MARILFGWEFGASLGHIYPLLRIADQLAERGHEPVFAARDVVMSQDVVRKAGYKMVQAPHWRNPPIPNIRSIPTPSYADVLIRQGFGDAKVVGAMMAAWDDLFTLVAPDFIIADHSPGLSLAARGKIPMANIGNGFTLPPTDMETYPAIISKGKPLGDQGELLALFNDVQKAQGAPLLDRVSQVFDTEGQFVCTLPQLDPYSNYRKSDVIGPLEEALGPAPEPDTPHVFFYMANEAVDSPVVLEGLIKSEIPASVYWRGASEERRKKYQVSQITMLSEPVAFSKMLPKTSMVIHSGGAGTATACLMTGRLQIMFPRQSEASLNGRMLKRQGIASVPPRGVSADQLAKGLLALQRDRAMADRALNIADELADGDFGHALETITDFADSYCAGK